MLLNEKIESGAKLVSIIMGSDSDLDVMKETAKVLEEFEIPFEMTISSAHRSPARTIEYASNASKRGVEIIIAGAGRAAHLAGVIAAHTTLPVIGVPIDSGPLSGVDALYSIVQMPAGVPVATMAIGSGGARNAGILAAQILALKYPSLKAKLEVYKSKLAEGVERRAARLEELGYEKYSSE
ncbi:TPA: 5-(carboxyamino)imidazole ribonucleotide mutase [Candidatus Poribacteria bacterium]|nr:5-(carboxyamino)imidazole ribonucleotide mutase [Candidatus Poribacteria bacterium]